MKKKELRKEIRKAVREDLMNTGDVMEYDLLFSKESSWEDAKERLKQKLNSLLSKIENDEYSDGFNDISDLIIQLKRWRSSIGKHLNDNKK